MTSIERIVIVGAGLAGARAAETLRKDGYDGAITLLGDEPDPSVPIDEAAGGVDAAAAAA